MRSTLIINFILICICLGADAKSRLDVQWPKVQQAIAGKEQSLKLGPTVHAKLEQAKDASAFTSGAVRSIFDDTSTTIRRRSLFKMEGFESSFLSSLDSDGKRFEQAVKSS